MCCTRMRANRAFFVVVFQYSVERLCRFSIVMIEEPAESFASGDRA